MPTYTLRQLTITLALSLIAAVPAYAQTLSGSTAVTLKRAQVTGIEDSVVTVAYTEKGRRVYDPLLVTPETAVFVNGKPSTLRAVRLRKYLWVAAVRNGDELVAQRIDVGGPPPKPKKVLPKPTVKSATVRPGE